MDETGRIQDRTSTQLAPREAEILAALVDGKQAKVIAFDLSLSPETVRYYIKRIYRALGVHNRAQAVARALNEPRLMRKKLKPAVHGPPKLKPAEFVGRDVELSKLLGLLGRQRLVTATGIGGNGKTTLARAAFESLSQQTASVWVSLKSVDKDALVHQIAQSIGIELRTPGQEAWQELGASLGETELFIVLDNFEHLVDQSENLSDLLSLSPSLTVLVTSRLPTGAKTEVVFPVTGLSLHEKGEDGPSKAADLFLQHAFTRQFESHEGDYDVSSVHEICVRLGGSPLAIKLAASWRDVLEPKKILQSLEEKGSLLAGPIEASRQEGVRDILMATLALRTDDERVELQSLSRFSGTFSLEGAQVVAGSDARSLATFVRSALVQPVSAASDTYAIHPLVGEILDEELAASNHADDVAKVHAEYVFDNLMDAGQFLSGARQAVGTRECSAPSVEDVKRAWTWACISQRFDLLSRVFVPFSAWMVWSKRGAEAMQLFDLALSEISKLPAGGQRQRLELDLRLAYGSVLMSCKGQAAIENGKNFAEALRLSCSTETPEQRHQALFGLSRFEMMREQYAQSHEHAVECFDLAKNLPNKSATIEAGTLLGGIDVFCGRIAAARDPLVQAANAYSLADSLPLRSRYGQDIGVLANSYLSWVEWQLGYETNALRTLRKAKKIADDLDDPIAVAWYCTYASALHLLRLDFDQSLELSEYGRAIAKDFDLTLLRVSLEGQIGWSQAMVGDVHAGRDFFHETLRERKRLGMRSADNWVALGVAMVDHRAGKFDNAMDTITERIQLSDATGSTWMISELTRIKGDILKDQGDVAGAETAYQRALEISDTENTLSFSARALLAKANLAGQRGDFDRMKATVERRLSGDLANVDTKEKHKLQSLTS